MNESTTNKIPCLDVQGFNILWNDLQLRPLVQQILTIPSNGTWNVVVLISNDSYSTLSVITPSIIEEDIKRWTLFLKSKYILNENFSSTSHPSKHNGPATEDIPMEIQKIVLFHSTSILWKISFEINTISSSPSIFNSNNYSNALLFGFTRDFKLHIWETFSSNSIWSCVLSGSNLLSSQVI